MSEKIIFILGDELPTYYDAVISIFHVAQGPKTRKMKTAIQAYITTLIDAWIKSFTAKHVITRTCITKKIENLVTHYYNNVYVNAHHRSEKHKKEQPIEMKSI